MIDHRFALGEFLAKGRNSPAAEQLASDLRVAIAEEAAPEVERLAEAVAAKLSSLGHSLTSFELTVDREDGAVCVTAIDVSEGSDRRRHRLRFNLDLVVSTGFPGYES